MKIALVSPYDWTVSGGVNSHCARLREQFLARDHQVRIVAPSSSPVEEDDVITIGKRPLSVPASGSLARISLSLTLAPPVRRVLAEEQFDVVHVHEPFMPMLPIHFLRYAEAVKVGTFHASREKAQFFYSWGRRHLRRWFRQLDGKIAVSSAASGFVEQYFPGYYNIIPNGVDIERFSAEAPPLPEYQDGKQNILFVGRPEKRKGLDTLIRAYERVKAQRPDTRLIVVGAGKFDRYQRAVRARRLADVVFNSYVSYEELPRYHQTANVFCAPATGFESQGIVILEAMAAGLPIVASNIEGYAGVLTHDVQGLLVLPGDDAGLADALLQLLGDAGRRRRMAAQGRRRAQEFSWQRVSQQILSYYERLLHERGLADVAREPAQVG
ncbi:MAG: glycosyltransferase family 4 protein [Chloroflexi bacterium]|nr:glycosyltransferase family 4 protein [Chloroflexota bacterium]